MASLVNKVVDKNFILKVVPRLYCTSGSQKTPQDKKPEKTSPAQPSTTKAERFDNTQYKAEEYYQYNDLSFYDIDNDMAKYRLPQQSSLKRPQP